MEQPRTPNAVLANTVLINIVATNKGAVGGLNKAFVLCLIEP